MDRRDFLKSACLKKCPQKLDIPKYMKQIAREFN